MNETQKTPHNAASKGQIAKTVLFPGDPKRARYIAENFLEGAKLVSDVRGMEAFTGLYKGKSVSVMGSGMGGPSAGIYSHELYSFYDADAIIRIGTAGGYRKELKPGALIFALTASTDSNYAYQFKLPGTFSPCCNFELLQKAVNFAREHSFEYAAGAILSSDMFSPYNALGKDGSDAAWKPWADMGCLAQDMETYALYCNAARFGKKALSIVTNTFNKITGQELEGGYDVLTPMIETALSLV